MSSTSTSNLLSLINTELEYLFGADSYEVARLEVGSGVISLKERQVETDEESIREQDGIVATNAAPVAAAANSNTNTGTEFIESLSLQYGEMPLSTWCYILFECIPREKLTGITHFLDLGCGNGKLLFTTALLLPHLKAIDGYELLGGLCKLGEEAKRKWMDGEEDEKRSQRRKEIASALRENGYAASAVSPQQNTATSASSSSATAVSSATAASAASLPTTPQSPSINIHCADFIKDTRWLQKAKESSATTSTSSSSSASSSSTALAASSSSSFTSPTSSNLLLYICATAFSESLRSKLFPLLSQLPIGTIVILVSYEIPKTNDYGKSWRVVYSSTAAAEATESTTSTAASSSTTSSASSVPPQRIRMSWGESRLFIYEKMNQNRRENNILKFFRKG